MRKKLIAFSIVTSLLLVCFVAGQESHDIAVTNVTTSTNIIYTGWTVIINVTALNNGTSMESFNVTTYYDNTLIGLQNVTDLLPSNTTTMSFVWDTTGVSLYIPYNVSANVTIVSGEENIENNLLINGTVMVVMLGDADGNQEIELGDFFIFSEAVGTYLGHLRWNPLADINQDGIVDMLDAYLIAQQFGETYP